MRYIDAEKLKAEIAKIYNEDYKFLPSDIVENIQDFKDDVLIIIDTLPSLQQEQPEVDLEKELDAFIKSGKAIKEENCGTYTTTYIDPLKVARHFYNLGLNARKEE